MRPLGALLVVSGVVLAGVPKSDSRRAETAGYKTHFRMPQYTSREQWEARKTHLRQQILSAAGLLPMPARTPLQPRIVRRIEYHDYSIEVVLLETLPGYFLGGNLYRPVGRRAPVPGVLAPHGHWKRGRLEDQPNYSVPALAINLARQGYIVFAYDMVGFNDTRQTPHSFGGWPETLWSFTPMGLQLWNSIRALDFLESLPEVDASRLAATGASGGGTQTFLTAAVDERIRFAAPVNMVSAYMQGGDPCEEAPNLRLETFNVEIAAMIAPRPMLLVSSTRDWTRHTPREEFPAIRRIYELYGAGPRVRNAHIDAVHNYNRQSREAVYRFLARRMRLKLSPAELTDKPFQISREEELLAYPKAGPPGTVASVFRAWREALTIEKRPGLDPAAQREALRYALGAEWPLRCEAAIDGHRAAVGRAGKGDRVTGYWAPGSGPPVVVLHPGGSAAALRDQPLENVLRSGRPVLILDPFSGDPARARRQALDGYFLSYHRTGDANQVQDILTALAFLHAQYPGTPRLIGRGSAGVACVFAAAAAPIEVDVVADLNGFSGSDQDFRDHFFVPGIQRAGGLGAALSLVASRSASIPPLAADTDAQ